MGEKILAFDIGGTLVKYGIITSDGRIVEKGIFNTDISNEEALIDSLLGILKEKKEDYKINGIALSMPGFIDVDTGTLVVCYAIRCMQGKSITKILSDRTGLKVTVENDSNCVALAEKFKGNAKDCDNFICISVGTGIGGGIFLNGKLVRGSGFKAGEFGFMVCDGIIEDTPTESTVSAKASMGALIIKYKEYMDMDLEEEITGEDVFDAAESDENVRAIIDEWYFNLSMCIINLAATLNPDKILIGGGISEREEFIDYLIKACEDIPWWNDIKTQIQICKYKNEAGIVGATYHYLNS